MNLKFGIALILSSTLLSGDLIAKKKKKKVPKTLEGVQVLTPKELKDFKENIIMVDVRKPIEYSEEHIPSAINIYYNEKSKKDLGYDWKKDKFNLLETLTKNNDSTKNIVFYCNGAHCWKSYKACVWAKRTKLKKKIFWLREGIPGWMDKEFPVKSGMTSKD